MSLNQIILSINGQNKILTNTPQIFFFKNVILKYSNFLKIIDTIKYQNSNNIITNNNFDLKNLNFYITNNKFDLINNLYFNCEIYAHITKKSNTVNNLNKWSWIKNLGYNIFENIELYIDNNLIETLSSEWLNIWHELNNNNITSNELIGNKEEFITMSNVDSNNLEKDKKIKLFFKIPFFFTKTYNLGIPVNLYQDKTTIIIKFNLIQDTSKLINITRKFEDNYIIKPYISQSKLTIEGVILDNNIKTNNIIYNINNISNNIVENSFRNIDEKEEHILTISNNTKINSIFWISTLNRYKTGKYFLGESLEKITKRFLLRYFKPKPYADDGKQINIYGDQINYIEFPININSSSFTSTCFFTSSFCNYDSSSFTTQNSSSFNISSYFNTDYESSNLFKIIDNVTIFKLEYINVKYRNLTNNNNKNLDEIINSAYINKNNPSDPLTLDDITVPELLPIEIASFTSYQFDNIIDDNPNNLWQTTLPIINQDTTSEGHMNYDIKYFDLSNYGLYIDGSLNIMNNFDFDLLDKQVFNSNIYNKLLTYNYKYIPKIGIYNYNFSNDYNQYLPNGYKIFQNKFLNFRYELSKNFKIYFENNLNNIIGQIKIIILENNQINYIKKKIV